MRCTPMSDRRADRAGRTRPAVVVLHHSCLQDQHCLREINAGMEEEGVPFSLEEAEIGNAAELAHAAAQASMLDVGVGVDAAGNICVQHAKLPLDAPALAGLRQQARSLGHNAARLVTGIPFKSVAQ